MNSNALLKWTRVVGIGALATAWLVAPANTIIVDVDSPTVPNAPKKLELPDSAKAGDVIQICVKNVNPLLYKVEVKVDRRKVDANLGSGIGQVFWGSGQPVSRGAPVKEWISLPETLKDAFQKTESEFQEQRMRTYPSLLAVFEKKLNSVCGNGGEPITVKTIRDVGNQLAEDEPAQKDKIDEATEKIVRIFGAAAKGTTVTTDVTMSKDEEVDIKVTVSPYDSLADADGKSIDGLTLDKATLIAWESETGTVALRGAQRGNWSAAVMFSDRRDNAYRKSDENKVQSAGSNDQASVYIGTLYHFEFAPDDKLFLSMGTGTNGSKLLYFFGLTFRLGKDDNRGFLSIGLTLNQVTRLDGMEPGDTVNDDKDIRTKQVFERGLGIALSFRF